MFADKDDVDAVMLDIVAVLVGGSGFGGQKIWLVLVGGNGFGGQRIGGSSVRQAKELFKIAFGGQSDRRRAARKRQKLLGRGFRSGCHVGRF